MRLNKLIIGAIVVIGALFGSAGIAYATTVLFEYQGGTGFGGLTNNVAPGAVLFGNYGLTTLATSTGLIFATSTNTLSVTNLNVSGTCTNCGIGGNSFGYPFPSNATTTDLTFTNGATIAGTNITGFTGVANSNIVLSSSPTLSGTLNVPQIKGGVGASSVLTLESTSGVGTTDSIVFKTGSQVTALTINASQQAIFATPLTDASLTGLIAANNGLTFAVTTTTVTCSGNTSCSPFTVLGSSPVTISSTGGTSPTFGTSSITALWPVIYTQSSSLAQLSFGGLSTSTNLTQGSVPYVTGVNTFGQVSTTTLTASGVLTLSNPISVFGSTPSTLTLTGGGNGQVLAWLNGVPTWTASTSIVAGTNITISTSGGATTINANSGSSDPFTHGTVFGQAYSATSTALWLQGTPNALFASGTIQAQNINIDKYSGYYQGGTLLAYGSSTNADTLFGLGAGGTAPLTSATLSGDTAIGYQALGAIPAGIAEKNTAVGYQALQSATGAQNVAVGYQALSMNITTHSGTNDTSVGYQNLTAITTGNQDTSMGNQAMIDTTVGNNDTSLGYESAALGTGENNGVFLGYASGLHTTTSGDNNVDVGYESGNAVTSGADNILIGSESTTANANLTTGSQNILIAYNSSLPSASANGQLDIGNEIYGTGITGTGSNLSGGLIGIGTTTPATVLAIQGSELVSGNLTIASETATGTLTLLPLATPAGSFLAVDPTGKVIATTSPSGGGGGTPGGSSSDVQYNNSGAFAGDSGLTYDGSGNLTASNSFVAPNATFAQIVTIGNNSALTSKITTPTSAELDISPDGSLVATTNNQSGTQTGVVSFGTGFNFGDGGTGAITFTTGGSTGTGNSGNIQVATGKGGNTSGQSGNLIFGTGSDNSGDDNSGFVKFATGLADGTGKAAGNIIFAPGGSDDGIASEGLIQFQDGNSGNLLTLNTSNLTTGQLVYAPNDSGTFTVTSGGVSGHCVEWLDAYTLEDAGSACGSGGGGSSTFGTSSLSAVWPLIYTQSSSLAQFSFGGLGTSTNLTKGQIPYVTGVNTFGQVATTTASCSGTASCSPFTVIGSSPIIISGTGGSGTVSASPQGTFGYFATQGTTIAGSYTGYASSTNRVVLLGTLAGGGNATTSATVQYETAVGYNALAVETSGIENTAIGDEVLENDANGIENTGLGVGALQDNVSGSFNTALGYHAAQSATTAIRNTTVGYQTLLNGTATYGRNTAVGYVALQLNTAGTGNTAIGASTGAAVSSTFSTSTIIGWSAGFGLTSGSLNTMIGGQTGDDITTGNADILIGANVTATTTTTSNALNIGNLLYGTGLYNSPTDIISSTPTNGFIGIGSSSPTFTLSVQGATLVSGTTTTAGLFATGTVETTGLAILGITGSTQCLQINTAGIVSGTGSVCATGGASFGQAFEIDASQWLSATTTTYGINTNASGTTYGYGLGDKLLAYASSTNLDTIFGLSAGGQNATTTATAKGESIFGFQAANALTTGIANTAMGYQSDFLNTTGTDDTGLGYQALNALDSGQGTSNNDTAVGYRAGYGNATNYGAQGLTLIGAQAGRLLQTGADYNTLIGSNAGASITTGASNIELGAESTLANANITSGSNQIRIGFNNSTPSVSNVTGLIDIQNLIYATNTNSSGGQGQGNAYSTGAVGIGSTSPFATLSVQGVAGATNTTLFAIASSTSSATTTFLKVDNTGQLTAQGPSQGIMSILTASASFIIRDFGGGVAFLEFTRSANFGSVLVQFDGLMTHSSGTMAILNLLGNDNESSTAGFVSLQNDPIITTKGSGLALLQRNGTSTAPDLYDITYVGHVVTSGSVPVLSSCGSSSISGNDHNGTITVVGTLVAACTLTFSYTYAAAPDCVVSDNSLSSTADISSVSATSVTFGLSSGINSGALYYQCEQHQ